eukprot:5055-Heterococcus_DN1.PRE.1
MAPSFTLVQAMLPQLTMKESCTLEYISTHAALNTDVFGIFGTYGWVRAYTAVDCSDCKQSHTWSTHVLACKQQASIGVMKSHYQSAQPDGFACKAHLMSRFNDRATNRLS